MLAVLPLAHKKNLTKSDLIGINFKRNCDYECKNHLKQFSLGGQFLD